MRSPRRAPAAGQRPGIVRTQVPRIFGKPLREQIPSPAQSRGSRGSISAAGIMGSSRPASRCDSRAPGAARRRTSSRCRSTPAQRAEDPPRPGDRVGARARDAGAPAEGSTGRAAQRGRLPRADRGREPPRHRALPHAEGGVPHLRAPEPGAAARGAGDQAASARARARDAHAPAARHPFPQPARRVAHRFLARQPQGRRRDPGEGRDLRERQPVADRLARGGAALSGDPAGQDHEPADLLPEPDRGRGDPEGGCRRARPTSTPR
jgi:hypothetical protein